MTMVSAAAGPNLGERLMIKPGIDAELHTFIEFLLPFKKGSRVWATLQGQNYKETRTFLFLNLRLRWPQISKWWQ